MPQTNPNNAPQPIFKPRLGLPFWRVVGLVCLGCMAVSCAAAPRSPQKSASPRNAPHDAEEHDKARSKPLKEDPDDAAKEPPSPKETSVKDTVPPPPKDPAALDPSPAPAERDELQIAPGNTITSEQNGSTLEGDTFDASDDPYEVVEELVESIEKTQRGAKQPSGHAPTSPSSPVAGSCRTVCDAGKAICVSSRRICTISARNPREPFFVEKCTWSKQACSDANTECSQCGN